MVLTLTQFGQILGATAAQAGHKLPIRLFVVLILKYRAHSTSKQENDKVSKQNKRQR